MSTEAVLRFREAVNSSDSLKHEVRALENGGAAEVVAVAARHGFAFTEAELAAVANSVGVELTEFELEMVGGGVQGTDILGGSYVMRNAATEPPIQQSKSSGSLC
jgi:predicted ribosomally synthesized peptide with nif11-like leader